MKKIKKTIIYLLVSGILYLALPQTALSEAISHIGTNQKVLVICVKYSDRAATRFATCNDWVNTLQTEVNTFYDRATFGRTTFVFEAPAGGPANGWYSLATASTGYSFWGVGQEAISLADPNVDFSKYNRVAVITNWDGFGGQGGGPWWWKTSEGIEATFSESGVSVGKRLMTLSIVNEWLAHSFGNPFDEAGSVVAHELGHHLGVPTHYADVRWFPGIVRDVISPWDIMGYSPTLNHFGGWAKYERRWMTSPAVRTVGPPAATAIDTTITLKPQETASGVRLIEIPIATAPFFGYYIENRRLINGDERLPSAGPLLTMVDTSPNTILKTIVLDDPGSFGDLNQAPLEVGDTFTDPAIGLTVTYLSATGNDANIRVRYEPPPAGSVNPRITPWGSPPWETPDIWVDSERNGWDTYRYTDGSGNPVGNGDDAWVNHVNRVKVRVGNSGTRVATNVRAEVYVNSPPGMGDAGAGWDYLGTLVFPSIGAGANATDFVPWTPTVGAHTCIKVVIVHSAGEASATDNLAQENISAFDTTAGSPYRPVGLRIRVNNPSKTDKTPVHFHVRDIPPGWAVTVEPQDMTLAPGGSDYVFFAVAPSGFSEQDKYLQKQWSDKYRPGFIGKPKIEAQVPYADTYIPIGGVDVWTRLTRATRLTCGNERNEAYADPTGLNEIGLLNPLGLLDPKKPVTQIGKKEDYTDLYRRLFTFGSLVRQELFPQAVAIGHSLVVNGRIDPVIPGAVIAVEFTSEKDRALFLVKANDKGNFRAEFKKAGPGRWQARAYFDGDNVNGKSESDFCRYQIGQ